MEKTHTLHSISHEDIEIITPVIQDRVDTEIQRSFKKIIDTEDARYFFQKYLYIIPQGYTQ
jgi:hypothetical protein